MGGAGRHVISITFGEEWATAIAKWLIRFGVFVRIGRLEANETNQQLELIWSGLGRSRRRATLLVNSLKHGFGGFPWPSCELRPVRAAATGFRNAIAPAISAARTASPMLSGVTSGNENLISSPI